MTLENTTPAPAKGKKVEATEPKAPAKKASAKKTPSKKAKKAPSKKAKKAPSKKAKNTRKVSKPNSIAGDFAKSWNYDFADEEVIKDFSLNLYDLRIKRNITQEDLAAQMAYSRPAIVNMEAGRNGCTLPTMLRLCVCLDCTPADLLKKR